MTLELHLDIIIRGWISTNPFTGYPILDFRDIINRYPIDWYFRGPYIIIYMYILGSYENLHSNSVTKQ